MGLDVHFEDRRVVNRGYAPKGQTPILTQTGQKFSTSMIAAVSNRGLMRFRLYKGALNVTIFIDFLKRLVMKAATTLSVFRCGVRQHRFTFSFRRNRFSDTFIAKLVLMLSCGQRPCAVHRRNKHVQR